MAIAFRNPHGSPMALSGKKDWNCAAAVTCRLFVSWSFQGPVKVPRCRVLKRSKQAQQGSAHTTTTTTALHHHDRDHDHRSPPTQTRFEILRAYTSETSKVVINVPLFNIAGSNTERGYRNRRRNGSKGKKEKCTVRIHDRTYARFFAKPTKQSDVMVIYAIRRLDSCATTCCRSSSALTFCVSTGDVSLGITASLECCCCLYVGQEEKKEKDHFSFSCEEKIFPCVSCGCEMRECSYLVVARTPAKNMIRSRQREHRTPCCPWHLSTIIADQCVASQVSHFFPVYHHPIFHHQFNNICNHREKMIRVPSSHQNLELRTTFREKISGARVKRRH
jgi:hypothetical protein